jgi:hypothetical protein
VLIKAATILESQQLMLTAAKLYEKASMILTAGNKHYHAMKTFSSLNALYLRQGMITETIQSLYKQLDTYKILKLEINMAKSYLSIIILHLSSSEQGQAREAHEKFLKNGTNEYIINGFDQIAENLLDAYETGDQTQLNELLRNKRLKILENEIAKIALRLQIGTQLQLDDIFDPNDLT